MIQVKKPKGSAPPELNAKNKDLKTERQRAVEFFKVESNRQKTFPFKGYKAQAVRSKLDDLFHKKCAYCESDYGATQPCDVEHFRPKGAVDIDGKRVKPGYYWLAADWTNLLPSCIDCNRQRGHEDDGKRRVQMGKANKFPVKGKHRKLVPGVDKKETALLIHPCVDDPEKHLDFWKEGMVRPITSRSGRVSEKGRNSIEVFGLQRPGLIRSRRQRWLLIKQSLEVLRSTEKALASNNKDADLKQAVVVQIQQLRVYTEPNQPYLAMARTLLAREAPEVARRREKA